MSGQVNMNCFNVVSVHSYLERMFRLISCAMNVKLPGNSTNISFLVYLLMNTNGNSLKLIKLFPVNLFFPPDNLIVRWARKWAWAYISKTI